MAWNEAIYTLLYADSTISANVDTDAISPNYLPDASVKSPSIYFVKLDNPKIDDDTENWIRLRIWIASNDMAKCELLADAIDAIFNNGSGDVGAFTFDYTKLISKPATPIYSTNLQRYETFADVRVIYRDQ